MTTNLAFELTDSRLLGVVDVLRWLYESQPDANEELIGEAFQRVFELRGIMRRLRSGLAG